MTAGNNFSNQTIESTKENIKLAGPKKESIMKSDQVQWVRFYQCYQSLLIVSLILNFRDASSIQAEENK